MTLEDAKRDYAIRHVEYHRIMDRIEFTQSMCAWVIAIDIPLVITNLLQHTTVHYVVAVILWGTVALLSYASSDLALAARRWTNLQRQMFRVLREWEAAT